MIGLIITLVIIGVILYFISMIPMDATFLLLIRVVIIICVLIWLLGVFGIVDMPIPRLR